MIQKCDKIMVFAFCAMIFFLPISSAMVESLFGVVFLAFIVKRSLFFKGLLASEQKGNPVKLFMTAFKPVPNLVIKPVVFFMGAVMLSTFLSQYKATALKGFFFDLLQGVFLFFIFVECFNTQKRLKIFLAAFLASAFLVGIDGVVQYFTHTDFLRHHPVTDGRITGPFRHANDLGAYLTVLCPLLFCLSGFWRRITIHSNNPMKMPVKKHFFLTNTFKILMVVVFAIVIFCIGVTYSRSTWLAVLISMFILSFKRPKVLMVFCVCAGVLVSLFAFKMYQERTHPVKEYNTDTVVRVEVIDQNFFNPTGRVELWRQAWEVIKKRPLFGVGLNAYTKAAAQYTEINWDGYPHNSFLQIWAETGFFGFAAFLWILVRLFKTTYHVIIHIQDEFHHALLIGLTYGFLAFLIQAFFDTTLYSVQLGALMWLIIGFIVAIPKVVLRGEEGDKISSYSFH